ncbi:hypothetical protein JQX13_06210 [Archangium violaceum]|uniref:hypothetical protein n=1 Tax=Archangium violaceum TaxID=83451 RepID=UPI00193AE3D6|nr:hypothetical protein [Archangium violaceum]QRK09714.1 hypothetical protein JQX13_06210 [Archangium violaceum]
MRIGRLGLVGVATLVASCGGKEFRVGGTISGLSGGITLQLNGQEDLTREADGPFSFETRVEDGEDYAVTVATAPPEQDCTVEGGTGKVAGADVGSVQVRCAARTYSLGGTVEGLDGTLELSLGGETLRVTTNGRYTFATKLPRGGTYTVGVASQPANQRCSVSNGSGTVAGNVEDLSVRCVHWYVLDNHQAASVVIGQKDFTSGVPDQGNATAGANTLNGPWGNPVLAGGRLYVSDQSSHRVLGFDGVPAAHDASATFVLGQADFTGSTPGFGQSGLERPEGLASDGTRLAVVDYLNNRVLLYPALPTSSEAPATRVLGQPGFDENDTEPGPCDASSFHLPEGAFIGHGKVLVADSAHNRVLVWNTIPTTNGAPADLVLGQRSFDTCASNDTTGDGVSDGAPSASTLWNPMGVWTDGTRLVVVDGANSRVLIWNQFPTSNGQGADLVLGQPDFTSRGTATTASGLRIPSYVASTGLQLFVADSQNHRVLGWNQFPTTNGAEADLVLGQPDFTSATESAPSDRGLHQPGGLLLAWPHVVVPDTNNNRLLVFTSR